MISDQTIGIQGKKNGIKLLPARHDTNTRMFGKYLNSCKKKICGCCFSVIYYSNGSNRNLRPQFDILCIYMYVHSYMCMYMCVCVCV